MAKKGFGYNLSTGLKGLAVGILTMLLMILPAWLVKWIWSMENMLAVAALLGIVWMIFYLEVWGMIWNWISKWWK